MENEKKDRAFKATIDMTQGNIQKTILLFALPIFLSSLFQTLYSSIDSLIVSKFIGNDAFASITNLGSLIHMTNSFFIGTSMGAGVVISRYFGAKDYERMHKAIHTDILLGLIAGIMLTLVGVGLLPVILDKLMNLDSNILPLSKQYIIVLFSGAIANVMYNIFNGILNAVGNSKRSLIYLIISSAINICLDLLFVGVFKWGVWSAALATIISQLLSAILAFSHLLNKKNVYFVTIKDLKFYHGMTKEILIYGVPTGVQNSVIGFANVLVQSNINSFGGVATTAAGAFAKIESYVFLPVQSFTMAIATFISQNLGANEFDRAKRGARFGILTSITIAESFGILLFFMCPVFVKIFINNTEGAEITEQIINLAVTQSKTEALFFAFLALSHCMAAVFRGSGKAIIPMIIMLAVWCVFRSIYVTIMMAIPATHDIRFIYLAYPITWTISTIIYTIIYFKSDWVHNFVRKKELEKANLE